MGTRLFEVEHTASIHQADDKRSLHTRRSVDHGECESDRGRRRMPLVYCFRKRDVRGFLRHEVRDRPNGRYTKTIRALFTDSGVVLCALLPSDVLFRIVSAQKIMKSNHLYHRALHRWPILLLLLFQRVPMFAVACVSRDRSPIALTRTFLHRLVVVSD